MTTPIQSPSPPSLPSSPNIPIDPCLQDAGATIVLSISQGSDECVEDDEALLREFDVPGADATRLLEYASEGIDGDEDEEYASEGEIIRPH